MTKISILPNGKAISDIINPSQAPKQGLQLNGFNCRISKSLNKSTMILLQPNPIIM